MTVEWKCPRCKQTMYSAWDKRNQKTTKCIYCGYYFHNKYYQEGWNEKDIN